MSVRRCPGAGAGRCSSRGTARAQVGAPRATRRPRDRGARRGRSGSSARPCRWSTFRPFSSGRSSAYTRRGAAWTARCRTSQPMSRLRLRRSPVPVPRPVADPPSFLVPRVDETAGLGDLVGGDRLGQAGPLEVAEAVEHPVAGRGRHAHQGADPLRPPARRLALLGDPVLGGRGDPVRAVVRPRAAVDVPRLALRRPARQSAVEVRWITRNAR